jgi:glycosyltransferase involved in cell wall biosynthesis
MAIRLSIILPVYNEAGSLGELHKELKGVLDGGKYSYEVIAVNDGSKDNSAQILEKLAKEDKTFKVIQLSRNYGQTAALAAGIDAAGGEVLIPMDADLQNDPHDIPQFLERIEEGYDVVAGWRKDRQDNSVRRIPSKIANRLISNITGVRLHDYGCTMKAYKKEIIKDVRFYGEMHRFMPVYVAGEGAKILEMVVNHRARKFDKSKYGIGRTFRVVLDLLTVKFLSTYLTKPMHFFGRAGLATLFLSFVSGITAIVYRLNGVHFNRTPLPLLTAFLIMMGVQFILMGILAEILIRIYHEPQGKSTYTVKYKINFSHAD